jgi:hypothetical protein
MVFSDQQQKKDSVDTALPSGTSATTCTKPDSGSYGNQIVSERNWEAGLKDTSRTGLRKRSGPPILHPPKSSGGPGGSFSATDRDILDLLNTIDQFLVNRARRGPQFGAEMRSASGCPGVYGVGILLLSLKHLSYNVCTANDIVAQG